MFESSSSFCQGKRPSHHLSMAEFPISLFGLLALAGILRYMMTTMINCEAKCLLEAICPTQAPRAMHSPADAAA